MNIELFGEHFNLIYLREMAMAYVLALPIAFDRERNHRSAGLRTFPIVSLASCSFLLVARDVLGDNPDALSRVFYGLITGIGFIGGGAIIKQGGMAHGTATAASVWATGAIGAAAAFDRAGIAVATAVVTCLTLVVFRPIKKMINEESNGTGDEISTANAHNERRPDDHDD
jgi:putative Mg2+ transporter-C (MgtC) family protein